MTVSRATTSGGIGYAGPLTSDLEPLTLDVEPLTLDTAYAQVYACALRDSVEGTVGLEIETHLVDLDAVEQRPGWARVGVLPDAVKQAAGRSSVTLEPGGQFELSGPALAGISAAVVAMREDAQRARLALADRGLGLAYAGADPLRSPERVNPRPRYHAMQEHFRATGRARPGVEMMASTAALQVNLQAGPSKQWGARVARAYQLGPTLIALSACSPWLEGRDSGWKSARQRAWGQLNARVGDFLAPSRDLPFASRDPAASWARYALDAPVMFVRSADFVPPGAEVVPVPEWVRFDQWVSGEVLLAGRAPTRADLDLHLSTLFPMVRLRGYLELRYLDTSPPRWWPGVAAVAATLMDDPIAADAATEATEATAQLWPQAARDGLRHRALAQAARRCLQIAADRVPPDLRGAVADLAELVESGRCPGDLLAERIGQIGPRAAFEESAHA